MVLKNHEGQTAGYWDCICKEAFFREGHAVHPKPSHKGKGGEGACPFTSSLVSVESYRIIQRTVVGRKENKGLRSDYPPPRPGKI